MVLALCCVAATAANGLMCKEVQCSAVQCSVAQYNTVQHDIVLGNTVQSIKVQYSVEQCCITIQYIAVQWCPSK